MIKNEKMHQSMLTIIPSVILVLFIFTVESDWKKAAMWSVPIYFFGNIVTAIWILTRLDQITDSK